MFVPLKTESASPEFTVVDIHCSIRTISKMFGVLFGTLFLLGEKYANSVLICHLREVSELTNRIIQTRPIENLRRRFPLMSSPACAGEDSETIVTRRCA